MRFVFNFVFVVLLFQLSFALEVFGENEVCCVWNCELVLEDWS